MVVGGGRFGGWWWVVGGGWVFAKVFVKVFGKPETDTCVVSIIKCIYTKLVRLCGPQQNIKDTIYQIYNIYI